MIKKISCVLFGLVIIFGLSLAMSLPAMAKIDNTTWYVAPTGSDTYGDGSETWVDNDTSGGWSTGDKGPWLTIQYAVTTAASGDTINVAAGTYNENLTIDKAVNLIGADKTTTFIRGVSGKTRVLSVNNVTNTMRVSGFTIDAANCDANNRGMQAVSSTNVTFEGNNIINIGDIGIWTGSNNIIRDNTITCSATTQFGGIYISGSGNIIDNNTITDFTEYGIYVNGGDTPVNQNNTITKNTLVGDMTDENGNGLFLYNSGGNTIGGASATDGNTISLKPHSEASHSYWYGIQILTNPDGYVTSNTIQNNKFDGGDRVIEVQGFVGGTTTFSDNIIGETTPPSRFGVMINGGSAVISGNIFHNVPGPIRFGRSGGAADMNITITGNTFNGGCNEVGAIYASSFDSAAIHQNSFNLAAGRKAVVNSYTSTILDATGNWWGNASGPYNAITNAGGLGAEANDYVDYSPWWGANYVGDAHTTAWTWHTNDSIQAAINAATAGDTVVVEDGTYNYAGEGSPAPSGLIKVTKALTIRAADGVRPVIDGTDFDGVFKIHPSALNPGDTVIIEGFEITGNSTTDIAITMQGCFDVTPAQVIIRNNWFHGMNAGIDFWGASSYLPTGWTSAVTNVEITGNKFYSLGQDGVSQGFGIMLEDLANWTTAGNAYAAVVENNEFYDIYDGSGIDYGAGIILPRANDSWEAANASISGNNFTNISIGIAILDGDVTHANISNNIFEIPSVYAVTVSSIDNGPVNAVNNWWGSANGPAHAGNTFNTGSQGSAASDYVNYTPWLNAAPPTGVSFAPVTNGANGYASIQAAVDAASAGNTIDIAAGTYNEQVVIGKALTLQGAGDTTVIQPYQTTIDGMTLFDRYLGSGNTEAAIVVVTGADSSEEAVILKDFKVDASLASGLPGGADMLEGIFYRNSNGTIDNLTVNGCGTSIIGNTNGGIRCVGFAPSSVTVEIRNCNVLNYTKNGITCSESNLTVNIHDNTVTGLGSVDWTAQNGIQLGFGAAGTISNNTVLNHGYNGATYWAAGILIYQSDNIAVSGNTVTANQAGIYINQSNDCTVSGNTISNTATGQAGIMVSNRDDAVLTATGNTITGNTISGGWAGIWSSYCSGNTYSDNTISACTGNGIYFWDTDGNTLEGNNITNIHDGGGTGWGIALDGGDTSGTTGSDDNNLTGNTVNSSDIGIWIGNGSDNNTVESNTITGNLTGIEIGTYSGGAEPTGNSIHFNDITGNTTYGANNTTATVVDATNNWWGDASGPSGVGPGAGDSINVNVDYAPWLGALTVYTQTETVTNDTVDAIAEANLEVLVDGTATVTVAEYNDNPGDGSFTGDLGKYIDVYIGDTSGVNEIEIRLYYTNADLNGHIESMLTMNWWNGNEWVACSNTGVNTADIAGPPAYSGYMWAVINDTTTPSLADLAGTAFGGGGLVIPQPTYIPPIITSAPPVTTVPPTTTTTLPPTTTTSVPPATTTSAPPATTTETYTTPSTIIATTTPPTTTTTIPTTSLIPTTTISAPPVTTPMSSTPTIDWIIGGGIFGGVLIVLVVILFVRRS